MKKICTITCHDVYNAGASLQAYALMSYLSECGYRVEIIDYKPEYLSRHYYLWGISSKFSKNIVTKGIYYTMKLPKRLLKRCSGRKRRYDRFRKEYLSLTEKRYHSNEELKNNIPNADIYIAGSDQIWNPILENGKDPSFYLDFVPDSKKKISYAGSFSVNELPEQLKGQVRCYLKRFDAISVRESSAINILADLGLKGEVVVDPVFLLERQSWEKICGQAEEKEYLLIYDFDKNPQIKELALRIARERKWKIYSVLKCDYADKSFNEFGPDKFVSLIKNASYVLSNSFHATAFSIIFNTPFCVFNREWGINSRMKDLLRMCGIESRLIDLPELPFEEINWNDVNEKMNQMIKKSKKFLEISLEQNND